jgi:hypothetical protein
LRTSLSRQGKERRFQIGDAEFSADALFNSANFGANAQFFEARFRATASFAFATFDVNADFSLAKFGADADFSLAKFGADADFSSVTFASYVRFQEAFEENASLGLMDARIEKPERIAFHTVRLRPHWFVDVDVRKFEFVSVKWNDKGVQGEIGALREKKAEHPPHLLSIAYRQLAVHYWEADGVKASDGSFI